MCKSVVIWYKYRALRILDQLRLLEFFEDLWRWSLEVELLDLLPYLAFYYEEGALLLRDTIFYFLELAVDQRTNFSIGFI